MTTVSEQFKTIIHSTLWAADKLSYEEFNKVFPDGKAKEIRDLIKPLYNSFEEVNRTMIGFNSSFDMSIKLKSDDNQFSENQIKLIEECYLINRILNAA